MKSCHCVVFGDKMSQPCFLLWFRYTNHVSQDKLKVRRESEAEVKKKNSHPLKTPGFCLPYMSKTGVAFQVSCFQKQYIFCVPKPILHTFGRLWYDCKDFDSLSFWLDAIPADTVEALFAQCFLKIPFLQLGKGEGLWNNKKLNLYLCH